MKGASWKLVVILVVLALAILGLYSKKIRLGTDLQGGAELLFRIDTAGMASVPLDLTQKTVDVVRERIDPNDQKGLLIQSKDQQRILMQLPGYSREATKDVINLATNLGKLEWRVVAKTQDKVKIDNLRAGHAVPGFAWYPYSENARKFDEAQNRQVPDGLLLVTNDGYDITGELLNRVHATTDEVGAPAVGFQFKPEGAKRFSAMTGDHIGEQIAIVLNNEVYSAPRVDERIASDGIIKGIPTAKEVDMLVKVLNSGSLKAPLILESEQYVGPSLGKDTITSAVKATVVASAFVIVFMLVYYFYGGLLADIALLFNILIVMSFMIFSESTLTLPGIAGLILSIGMAVDTNVLIFERVREELRAGRDLATAIRLGYDRAFSAIFDTHLTTIATGVILYVWGSGPVAGFAITLNVGLIANFFTAFFVTKVIYAYAVQYNVAQRLSPLHLFGAIRIFSRPNFPFMKYARYFVVLSILTTVIGMSVFISRGRENLDTDFTGGSVAKLELAKPLQTEEVRKRIQDAGYTDVQVQSLAATVQKVTSENEIIGTENEQSMQASTVFNIRTPLQKGALETFEQKMGQAFADVAQRRTIAVTERRVTDIVAKNDPFVNGISYEAQLGEPLAPSEITAELAAAGLPKHEVAFYQMNSSTGQLEALPQDAPKASIFVLKEAGLDKAALTSAIGKAFSVPNPFPEEISQIGSAVAAQMTSNAIIAIVAAMIFMIVYLWFRFGRLKYGLGAVVALIHDTLFTLGLLAIGDSLSATPVGQFLMLGSLKISLPVVAALLTLVGYSSNDTIVVFDRIRENMRLKTKSDWEIITSSINQTLSRTILTSATVFLVVAVMYFVGGPGIHAFSFVMLIGVIVGTYSSIFIASPILMPKDVLNGKPIAEESRKQSVAGVPNRAAGAGGIRGGR